MAASQPPVFDSADDKHDDAFWLEQGQKLIEESLPSIREAAKGLMTALGAVKGIYLGIIGLKPFFSAEAPPSDVALVLYLLPLLFWLASIYFGMGVMMTRRWNYHKDSPDSIQDLLGRILKSKQQSLFIAFWLFGAGIVAALFALVGRAI